jgi:methylenetetrahydrofolate reductase (NADPH)
MRLDQLFASRASTLSFEFFPPKSERGLHTLEDTVESLAALGPDFVSVTYGAGGSTRAKTREIIEHIQGKSSLTAMAHLTCVNATRSELTSLLNEYAAAGIENLLALRGDPPKGETRFTPTDGGCAYAKDLIDLIQADGRFATLCAAFPEKHPDAPSREADWNRLADKFSAGACAAITQCFFDVADYRALRNRLPQARIIPGILPVVDFHALERFCQRCGATIPNTLRHHLAPLGNDPIAVRKAGIAWTVAFCRELLQAGAPGLHLYCLNRSTAAAEVVTALRLSGDLA